MSSRIFRGVAMALIGSLAALSGGCALFAAGNGPLPVDAKYVPPADQPMLVLVENYNGAASLNGDAASRGMLLAQDIKDNNVAPLVDELAVARLRDSNPDAYSRMGITEIARGVGAKQVLYVDLLRADLDIPSGQGTVRGTMEARVRMIDAQSGALRWPDASDGEPVQITTPIVSRDSASADGQVRHQMADKMATTITHLFHQWTPEHNTQESTDASGLAK